MRRLLLASMTVLACLAIVAGGATADPGQHEVNVTDGNGNVNATYYYNGSAVNVQYADGTWENTTLANPDESALAIQWALDNTTNSYSTVRVGPGVYNGSVEIDEAGRVLIGDAGPSSLTLQPRNQSTDVVGVTVTGQGTIISAFNVSGYSDVQHRGISVEGDADDVIVQNSVLQNHYTGIEFGGSNADDAIVIDNTFRGVRSWSVQIDGGTGSSVVDNEFVDDRDFSVFVRGGSNHLIQGNVIQDPGSNVREGEIGLGGTTGTTVADNIITNSTTGGIQLFSALGSPASTTLENNTVRNAEGDGIVLEASDSTTLRNNTLVNNTGTGLNVSSGETGVSISGTNATLNGQHGILVDGSDGTTLLNTTTNHNGLNGTRIVQSNDVTIDGGNASNNSVGVALASAEGGVVTNSTVTNNTNEGIFFENVVDHSRVADNTLQDNNVGIGLGESAGTSWSHNTIVDNEIRGSSYAGLAAQGVLASNNTIARNVIQTGGSNGLLLNAPDLLVHNNSIANSSWGINTGNDFEGGTIRDNQVTGTSTGIGASGADSTYRSNHLQNNDRGLTFGFASNVTALGTQTSDNQIGISIEDSQNVTIRDVTSTNDATAGISVSSSSTTVVTNATIRGRNVTSSGIYLDGQSDNATVTDSDVSNATIDIYANGSDHVLENNTVSESTSGVAVYGTNVTLDGTEASDNTAGIFLQNATEVTVRNPATHDNGEGILINHSEAVTVENAVVTNNNESGIEIRSTPNATVRGSTVLGNNHQGAAPNAGVRVNDAADFRFEDNVVRNNRLAGLRVSYADRARIVDNRITENCGGNFGISLADSDDVRVVGNNVSDNTGDGFQVFAISNNLTVRDTRINDNGGFGYQGEPGNALLNVTANGNAHFGISARRNATIRNVTTRNNGDDGLRLSTNSAVYDTLARNNTMNDVEVGPTAPHVSGVNLTVGSRSVDLHGVLDVNFNDAAPPVPTTPSDLEAVGPASDLSVGANGYANVSVVYTASQADGIDESSIDLYRYNATASEWQVVAGSVRDAAANHVSANVTRPATIRLFGEPSSSGGGGPVFIPAPPSGDESGGSPSFAISELNLDPTSVAVGEAVTVSVRVDNDGDADGTFTGNLTANGEVVDTGSVSVNQNYHDTLTLSTSFDEPGTYNLAVNGESAGTVEVTGQASFSLGEVSLSSSSVAPGSSVTISATVTNDGTAEDSVQVPLVVDGQQVDSRSVTLGPGESTTVTFEHTFSESGSQSVSLGGQEVGSVEVSDSAASSGGDGGSGLLVVAIVGLMIVGVSGGAYYFREEIGELVEK